MSNPVADQPNWGADHLRRAIQAAGVALWTWHVDTDVFVIDPQGYVLWDIAPQGAVTFEHLSEKIHPADRDRVRSAFRATRAVVGAYEIDFRILIGPNIRWISARGQGNDLGMVDRVMTGIFIEVTARKQAEEGHELLAGEMSHRVKNLLAIAAGLTKITAKSATSIEDMAAQLIQRLTALGRAHDLVRPLPGDQGRAALLGDVFTVLLAPYDSVEAFSRRTRISVPRMGVGEHAATALALVIHELATNALKYGALSLPEGTVDVSGNVIGDTVEIVWSERGGPSVVQGENQGYGSKLIRRTIEGTLGGSISHEWPPSGAQIMIVFDRGKLAH